MVQTIIYYSAPRLDVEPRNNVRLTVSISQPREGDILASVEIYNRSGTTLLFSVEDVKFFIDCVSVERESPRARVLEISSSEADKGRASLRPQ